MRIAPTVRAPTSVFMIAPLRRASSTATLAQRAAGPCGASHTIDRWDDATGENLIEQIAAVGDYLLALATYRAAVKRWPKDKMTLCATGRGSSSKAGGIRAP